MIIEASDVLNDAVACVVPNIDAEGKVGVGLHWARSLLDWPAPRVIYIPCCCVPRGVNPDEISEKETHRHQAAVLAGVDSTSACPPSWDHRGTGPAGG